MSPRTHFSPRLAAMVIALAAAVAGAFWFGQHNGTDMVGNWHDAERYILAATTGARSITVVDAQEGKIVGRINVDDPVDSVVVSELGDLAYVGHAKAHRLSIVDLELGRVREVLELPVAPLNLVTDAQTGVLVTDSLEGGMALVDLYGRSLIFANPDIPASSVPIFGANGSVAFYHSAKGGEVGAVSMANGQILWRIETPALSENVPPVRSLDGLFVVVTFSDKGEIAALDASSGQPLVLHRFGPGIAQPFVTSNGYYFLVPDPAERKIHVLSQIDFSLLHSISLTEPADIAVAGFLDTVGVAVGSSEVFMLDLGEMPSEPTASQTMPGAAADGLVTSDGLRAFFAVPDDRSIVTINLRSHRKNRIVLGTEVDILAMGSTNSICH